MTETNERTDLNLWFRELHDLIVRYFDDMEGLASACIEAGVRMLGLSTGIVSRVKDDIYEIVLVTSPLEGFAVGDTFGLAETYCSAVVNTGTSAAYHDVAQMPKMRGHPVYLGTGLRAYIGAPILVDDVVYGTLNFSDHIPRKQPFSSEEHYLVESMATLIGHLISRQRKDQMLELTFKHGIVGKAIAKTDGTIIDVNQAMTRTLEYARKEMIGKSPLDFTLPADRKISVKLYAQLFAGEIDHFYFNKRYLSKSGGVIDAEVGVVLARDERDNPSHLILQLIDRTKERAAFRELESANSRLSLLSMQDGLTGLMNRRAFDHEFKRVLERTRNSGLILCLVLFDIDHFKKVNDQHGHRIGDEVLVLLATILKESLRSLEMVARVGGEEFALILPETPVHQAALVIERIRDRIANAKWPVPRLTCSFGVATTGRELRDSGGLYEAADQALYQAKASGRDCVVIAAADQPIQGA